MQTYLYEEYDAGVFTILNIIYKTSVRNSHKNKDDSVCTEEISALVPQ